MKILELDGETTGLEEKDCVLIEVAARVIAPGRPPTELGRFHRLIKPAIGSMASGEEYALNMHRESGLLEKAVESTNHVVDVDKEMTDFIDDLVDGDEKLVLMGNSIHFDARFIKKYMPRLHKRLHYHQLDVTSINVFMQLFGVEDPMNGWVKRKAHTAESDLDETWKEVNIYARSLGLLEE